MKEAKEQKPLVDKLNELSSSLLDLIPWHTREGLDRMVTEDNERYRAFCEAAAQQVEQIDADLLKSQQVNCRSSELLFAPLKPPILYILDLCIRILKFTHERHLFSSFLTSLNKLQRLNSPG